MKALGGGGGGGQGGTAYVMLEPPPPAPPPPPETVPVELPVTKPEVVPPPPPDLKPIAAVDSGPTSTQLSAGSGGGTGGGQGTGNGPGTGSGVGPGSGGGSGGGTGTGQGGSPPVNRQMIIPPLDAPKSMRGKAVQVVFTVDTLGRVADLDISPQIADRGYARRFDEVMRAYRFAPARDADGHKISATILYSITIN
jgi:protein TonB